MALSHKEKDAIRNRACALCLALPPFADGSRCDVHRVIPGRHGGLYVPENVVPLCPPCHAEVDAVALIAFARKGFKASVASRMQRIARQGMTSAELARQSHAGKLAAKKNKTRRKRDGLSPAELAHQSRAGKLGGVARQARYPEMTRNLGLTIGREALKRYGKEHPEQRRIAGEKGRASLTREQLVANGIKGGKRRQELARLARAAKVA